MKLSRFDTSQLRAHLQTCIRDGGGGNKTSGRTNTSTDVVQLGGGAKPMAAPAVILFTLR